MHNDELRDFGIAVQDSIRLDRIFSEFVDLLQANPPVEGDSEHYYSNFSMTPPDEELIHKWRSRDVATYLIQSDVVAGKLPVWVRLRDNESRADAEAFANVDQRTWRSGLYRGGSLYHHHLDGRPLWVKHVDRSSFIERVKLRWTTKVCADEPLAPTDLKTVLLWSEKEMIQAIIACPITNREKAWKQYFGPRLHEHGWTNEAFRLLWPIARGSKGRTGRPPRSQS